MKFRSELYTLALFTVLVTISTAIEINQNDENRCQRTFVIDPETNSFVKDCKPFRYISGSFHYFNVPYQLWEDRMKKIKAAGANAIQTYIEWRLHQPHHNKPFDFESPQLNLRNFFSLAQKYNLLVLLRPGPYIDAEREMGGLPWWLLQIDPNMKLRQLDTSKPYNATYMYYAEQYYRAVIQEIMRHGMLYRDGGPIIMIQVENEYGSYGSDYVYLTKLRDIIYEEVGGEGKVLLYTTDGPGMIDRGKVDGAYATVDFGAASSDNVDSFFETMRIRNRFGPSINSEFYTGWLDVWGETHQNVDYNAVFSTFDYMLSVGANVNMYMFIGGTHFGFDAGGELTSGYYESVPTSYDYDAPLSEAGDVTDNYFTIRDIIAKYLPNNSAPVPPNLPKMQIKNIKVKKVGDLRRLLNYNIHDTFSVNPLSFEDIDVGYGFVLYSTNITIMPSDPAVLQIPNLADTAQVYVKRREDGSIRLQGVLSRNKEVFSMPILVRKGDELHILVENQGRVCYGSGIADRKGIFSNVTLNKQVLTNWRMRSDPINPTSDTQPFKISNIYKTWREFYDMDAEDEVDQSHDGYAVYSATFNVSSKRLFDTYLQLDGFSKGVAVLNDYILGRYWPVEGPQVTLYAPAPFFNNCGRSTCVNTLTIMELEHVRQNFTVNFVKTPILDGPVPDI